MTPPDGGELGVRVALLTVSDSRDLAADESGRLLEAGFRTAGHEVIARRLTPDGEDSVRAAVRELLVARPDALVVTGGSGVGPRDRTPEAVAPLLERALPGFGELFRQLSFREVGTRALASRALAGQAGPTLLFVLPGSPQGCRLALEEILLPELPHLVRMQRGGGHGGSKS